MPEYVDQKVNVLAWSNGQPEKAKTVNPVKIQLKDPNKFPSCKQYHIKPEARKVLLSIEKEF